MLIFKGIPLIDITAGYDRALCEVDRILRRLAVSVDFTMKHANCDRETFLTQEENKADGNGFLTNNTSERTTHRFREGHNPDDDSDISWYFDDGKVPSYPTLDTVVMCPGEQNMPTINQVTRIDAQRLTDRSYQATEATDASAESDDEFGSCFDDIEFRERDIADQSVARNYEHVKHPSSKICDKPQIRYMDQQGTSICKAKKSTKQKVDTEMLLPCTKDFETTDNCDKEKSNTEQERDIASAEQFSNIATTEVFKTGAYSHNNLANRINEILASKKLNTKPSITNYCRHFKTIESSAEEIQAKYQTKTDQLKIDGKSNINSCDIKVDTENVTNISLTGSQTESVSNMKKQIVSESKLDTVVNIAHVLESFKRKASHIYPFLHDIYTSQLSENANER